MKKYSCLLACLSEDHDDGQDNYKPVFVPDNVTAPNLYRYLGQNGQQKVMRECKEHTKKLSASMVCAEYTAVLATSVGRSSIPDNTREVYDPFA